MKRTFKCAQCSAEFEIEADYFMPGIKGHLVDNDGTVRTFVDPTEDHLCDICIYYKLRESIIDIVRDEKAEEILAEHDQRVKELIDRALDGA